MIVSISLMFMLLQCLGFYNSLKGFIKRWTILILTHRWLYRTVCKHIFNIGTITYTGNVYP